MVKVESNVIHNSEDIVLFREPDYMWKLGILKDDVIDGAEKIEYIDTNYVLINVDGRRRLIKLSTKEILLEDISIRTIVGDIAVTNEGNLYDLQYKSYIDVDGYKYHESAGEAIVLRNDMGNYRLYNAKHRKVIYSYPCLNMELLKNGDYALIKRKKEATLYSTKEAKLERILYGPITRGENYLKTNFDGIVLLDPLQEVKKQFYGKIRVYGKYGVITDDRKSVVDLTNGCEVISKKFSLDDSINIVGDYAIVNPGNGFNYSALYDLKTGKRKLFHNKRLSLLGDDYLSVADNKGRVKIINIKTNTIVIDVSDCVKAEKIGDFIIFMDYSCTLLYNLVTNTSYRTSLSKNDIKQLDGGMLAITRCGVISEIYAPNAFDKYDIKYDDLTPYIELLSLPKKDIFTTTITTDEGLFTIRSSNKEEHDEYRELLVESMAKEPGELKLTRKKNS